MNSHPGKLKLVQWILWIVLYLLMLLYNIRTPESIRYGLASSTIFLLISLAAIYTHALLLLPHFFLKEKKSRYYIFTLIAVLAIVGARVLLDYFILNKMLGLTHFFNLSFSHFSFAFLTVLLCFIVGFLLRISLDHVQLLAQQETMRQQQTMMELQVLKAQIQPHFMFNTLNNIYSLASRKSDKTADVVARLADIMRYLVYDAGKDNVPFSSELDFIRNYIELERIRMVNELKIDMVVDVHDEDTPIPPLLFIPFVENFFKHGLDKTRRSSEASIAFRQRQGQLAFQMKNIFLKETVAGKEGVGLQNIRKRLDILFRDKYELKISYNSTFEVVLVIPFGK